MSKCLSSFMYFGCCDDAKFVLLQNGEWPYCKADTWLRV